MVPREHRIKDSSPFCTDGFGGGGWFQRTLVCVCVCVCVCMCVEGGHGVCVCVRESGSCKVPEAPT